MCISQFKRNFSVYFSNTVNQHLVRTEPGLKMQSLPGKQEEKRNEVYRDGELQDLFLAYDEENG